MTFEPRFAAAVATLVLSTLPSATPVGAGGPSHSHGIAPRTDHAGAPWIPLSTGAGVRDITTPYSVSGGYDPATGRIAFYAAGPGEVHYFFNDSPIPGAASQAADRLLAGTDSIQRSSRSIDVCCLAGETLFIDLETAGGTNTVPVTVATDNSTLQPTLLAPGTFFPVPPSPVLTGLRTVGNAAGLVGETLVISTLDIDNDTLYNFKYLPGSPPSTAVNTAVLNVGGPPTTGGTHPNSVVFDGDFYTAVVSRHPNNRLQAQTFSLSSGGSFPAFEIGSDVPSSVFGEFAATATATLPSGRGAVAYVHLETSSLRLAVVSPTEFCLQILATDPAFGSGRVQPDLSYDEETDTLHVLALDHGITIPELAALDLLMCNFTLHEVVDSFATSATTSLASNYAALLIEGDVEEEPPPVSGLSPRVANPAIHFAVRTTSLFADDFEAGNLARWTSVTP